MKVIQQLKQNTLASFGQLSKKTISCESLRMILVAGLDVSATLTLLIEKSYTDH